MSHPKLSFIVLCYNYEMYIGQAIRSILDQTVQDFEIVVVDDGSTDKSRDVIASFGDSRIRLLVNDHNIGGAASYNRAVQAATGDYLVNLDADDWIAPRKSEIQLAYLEQHKVEVLGTYTSMVDANGRPHPNAIVIGDALNRQHDLNSIDAWIGQNNLVRSSTMVERAAHLQIGFDDPAMVRACDYELWTRFVRAGYRFAIVPELLTYYRLHARGVTHVDPRGTLLEMSYAMLRNLVPLIEVRAAYPSLVGMLKWMVAQESFAGLLPVERYCLLGIALSPGELPDFQGFCAMLADKEGNQSLVAIGRRLLATLGSQELAVQADQNLYIDARDFWHQQSQSWEAEAGARAEASDFWHQQSQSWENEAGYWRRQSQSWEAVAAPSAEAREFWHQQSQASEARAASMAAQLHHPIYGWVPPRVLNFVRRRLRSS